MKLKSIFDGYAKVTILDGTCYAGAACVRPIGRVQFLYVTAPPAFGETVDATPEEAEKWGSEKVRKFFEPLQVYIPPTAVLAIEPCSITVVRNCQPWRMRAIAPPDASTEPSPKNMLAMYCELAYSLDLGDYDRGVMDALGWGVAGRPCPQLEIDEVEDEAEDETDDLIAGQQEEYTGV